MAMGGACGMMSVPASALELGELSINSSLGQPLRASIAFALTSHEQLYDFCVYLRPGLAANGLPVLSRAIVSIADGAILLTGSRAIREPMLTMQVSIDCPYTAHISREYTLMINPPTPVVEVTSLVEPSTAPVPASTVTVAEVPQARTAAQSRRNIDQTPIFESSRYLVQRGDSLSDIASRISDRSIALWPAVDRIFAANPDAFMNGNVNRLKAGSWLEIPDLSVPAETATVADTVVVTESVPAVSEAQDMTAYTGYETPAADPVEEPVVPVDKVPTPAVVESSESVDPFVSETDAAEFSNLQPGDAVVGNDSAFVYPIDAPGDSELIVIPDTEIIQPAPVVITGQSSDAGKTSGSWSWFIWLGGTGLALILGLLLFGQRFREKFGSVAVGVAAERMPSRRRTDAASRAAEAADVDFQVPGASPHSASMSLDADFDDGSGLQDAADMDVAQDFGFSASTTFNDELDMELPEGGDEEEPSDTTDIIPPTEREVQLSILESEVLPGEDDYDLSMIVDVTKQDIVHSDATEKDLQAVQLETVQETCPGDYTLSQETDYKILEQDYQDEFTATQVLNAEIEKAAAELADRMDIDATGEIGARLPENTQAVNDDINDSGVNDVTAELPDADNDQTVEMPADGDELTANMEIESGIVDTKKKKKAS